MWLPLLAVGMAAVGVPRRGALLGAPTLRLMAGAAATRATSSAVEHELRHVDVAGVAVPVAIWRPARPDSAAPPAVYPYRIDIGKIAARLRVGWLAWLPRFQYDLPCGAAEASDGRRARDGDAILFAHGFLGSVYDFAHAAEALAADGFVVAAPELPESLSASYVAAEGMSREQIVAATRALVAPSSRWGIFGHSAGAATSLLQPGRYELGRAALAGGTRLLSDRSRPRDPVFLCSSNGDGCMRFFAPGVVDLRPTLVGGGAASGGTLHLFERLEDAYAVPSRPPPVAAFVFAEDNTPLPLPCHISFLWREVNDAMCSLLGPLLPLARALGLFVLDFDVYLKTRDADKTAAQVVPALRRFFLASSSTT
ncbi:hypothetical protein AB1Y20_011182 [Prymnesium parvum]|uniref:1-alkyl-2-acetylglycerophosphocholine esterase n=1 Tax=Prymnesium parvum TaxID=97485 RepID=A0AB34IMM5_PRYPA